MEDKDKRKSQLLTKPVGELIDIILEKEDEIEKMKDYRARLIKVRNLVTPPDQRRRQGRPSKDEGDII